MILTQKKETDFLQFKHLSHYSDIVHFVSTCRKKSKDLPENKLDISLETGKNRDLILQNRKILSKSLNIPLNNFVMQNQVHGNKVQIINEFDKGKGIIDHRNAIPDNDAMITNLNGICLFLFAADCVPVLFYDPVKKVIGAAHAGWKGTVKKIAQKTVIEMIRKFASHQTDILVGIGPAISEKNYEIGDEVVHEVENAFGTKEGFLKYYQEKRKYHMDLKYSNYKQLIDSGIPNQNIEVSDYCTYDKPELFFSARRKKNTGRFGAGIMLV